MSCQKTNIQYIEKYKFLYTELIQENDNFNTTGIMAKYTVDITLVTFENFEEV